MPLVAPIERDGEECFVADQAPDKAIFAMMTTGERGHDLLLVIDAPENKGPQPAGIAEVQILLLEEHAGGAIELDALITPESDMIDAAWTSNSAMRGRQI